MNRVPEIRITSCNAATVRSDGDFVLYWMIAFRRTEWNFALQRAVEWSAELRKPLLIFEPLRIGYRWAGDRIHRFVIEGMRCNEARIASLQNRGVRYFSYIEPTADAGKGLLAALARKACVVVTDNFPSFFLPRMVAAAAKVLPVRMEQVDSNGLLPLHTTDRVFTTAFSFRRFLQKTLPAHLNHFPARDPLARLQLPAMDALSRDIVRRWPSAPGQDLARLPIDHTVGAVEYAGGSDEARKRLRHFLSRSLAQYAELASHPDEKARSGLSPYIHFGHISVHELFDKLMSHEEWTPDRLKRKPSGKRTGWWRVSAGAEAWLDQLITWRELGFNMAAHCKDYDRYESLPGWSQATLQKHTPDRREHVYSIDQFASAGTHDSLWNATQRQLLREGVIHNYLRMLWGKKILEWTLTPQEALQGMIELNNRFALDGRDPNSYSGIFWVLGRYDRPWGPERPIFGTVRYMSSVNTQRKLRLKNYAAKFSGVNGDDKKNNQ